MWGGISLILVFLLINSTIIKYLVLKLLKKISGHVPIEKDELWAEVMDDFMKNRKEFTVDEVSEEVERRLNK